MSLAEGGAHVSVVSRHADRIFLCLFDNDIETCRVALDDRLGDVHSGFVPGLAAGMRYGLRAEGPWAPEQGHRFDLSKLLLDPYAREIDRPFLHTPDTFRRGAETGALVPKAIAREAFVAAGPLPPHRPQFIYEVAVKAFTKLHPDIPPGKRGTVAALAEAPVIAHLKRLGVDTVELMPLAAWTDERHLPPLGLSNAWGYNPVSFMAPDPRLAPGGLPEVREAVAALHRAGIRVILDVVFNHTGESDGFGPTLSFRGLDNALYYRHAGGQLVNDTGCGNTLALDDTPVMRLALDAMRSWVSETGVDGFRFDLATVMGRRTDGFDAQAPLLAAIEQDPMLSRLIMIAEPWDTGPGGYRLGQFPARWHEWNDRYRDEVRRFWRGDVHAAGHFATRITGSSDVFGATRRPSSSINYVAAHDGFTLRDTVTYAEKDNRANGEENRDGNAHEPTWVGGDVRALLATLFLSRGTPMLTAGDEFGRTQRGNNNAYAQDNATTWLDWAAADQKLIGFSAALARLRTSLAPFFRDSFLTGETRSGERFPDAEWFGEDGGAMDWHAPHSSVLGLILADGRKRLALAFNRGAAREALLPQRAGHRWERIFSSGEGEGLPPASVSVFAEETVTQAGLADDELRALAAEAGVASEWWEVDGTRHAVTPETLRALLAALGLPHGSDREAEEARRVLRRPGPVIGREGQGTVLSGPAMTRRRFTLTLESGETRVLDVAPMSTAVAELPAGYHTLSADDGSAPVAAIVSPRRCHVPDDIASGTRVFGLSSHLYALRHAESQGIGDFGTLRSFAGVTEDMGGRLAGLNPLHHLFPSDRSRVSPYQPSDRNYLDPIYIAIGGLPDLFDCPRAMRTAREDRAAFAALDRLPLVDYPAVWQAKSRVLEAAFAEFKGHTAFDRFVAEGGDALQLHGRFEAQRMGERPTSSRIAYRAFLQWIASRQLASAAANNNLYHDLALGSAFDGGEVAAAPGLFARGVSIGAPPDPFSAAGQVWNLPPFSPLELLAQGLNPFRRLLAANMRYAAALRIDHVLGFARQFWVPQGAEGKDGAYVRFPMAEMIAVTAIESRRHRCLVVGEDLGTVPDGLREALAQADIFSYRVLWFEREGQGFRRPRDYPASALCCLASHDLPTFRGWRAARDIAIAQELGQIAPEQALAARAERQRDVSVLDRLADARNESDAAAAVHGFVASAPSRIMLIQADDLAGETDPLNVPGTDREWPNWRRRVSAPVEALASSPEAAAIIARVAEQRER